MKKRFLAHLCNLLLVVHHQQRDGQQDDSEALHGFLEAPRRRQLVAVLQAGDEVGEAQAHSGQALLCATVLKKYNKITILAYCDSYEEENLVSCTFQFLWGWLRRQGRDGSPR